MLALATGNAQTDDGDPKTWVGVLKLIFGLLLLLIAVRRWRGRSATGARG